MFPGSGSGVTGMDPGTRDGARSEASHRAAGGRSGGGDILPPVECVPVAAVGEGLEGASPPRLTLYPRDPSCGGARSGAPLSEVGDS